MDRKSARRPKPLPADLVAPGQGPRRVEKQTDTARGTAMAFFFYSNGTAMAVRVLLAQNTQLGLCDGSAMVHWSWALGTALDLMSWSLLFFYLLFICKNKSV